MINELKKSLQPYFSKDETEENEEILSMVDEVCKDQIELYAREMDKIGAKLIDGKVKVPSQMEKIVQTFKKNDLFSIVAPEEYDGSELSFTLHHAIIERISTADVSASIYIALQGTLIDYLNRYGTDEAKTRYIPELANGSRLGGFLYSEPEAGSDLGSLKTTAVLEDDKYIINGNKIWISNAGVGDTYSFLASTDPRKGSKGLTAFVLDTRDQKGFEVLRLEDKLGIHASPTGQVSLTDVEIPKENVLGEVGKGFSAILYGLSSSRMGIGAQATGIAQAAYQKAVRYSLERKQFKTRIANFQGNQWKIADMATQIALSRSYYVYASRLKDLKQPFNKESSIAKLFASEMAQKVCYEAIQLHGGYGYTTDYDVERYYRDARVTTIYEGTSEVQRLIIAREEIDGYKPSN